jgi:7,8-dihydropterin-6-yl-methyl-4-(beta-D-ribofuranosyl)aminobenzene 5'-phosphate synthase
MAETKREKIVKMRVVVLADNRAVDAGFGAEHGLSIYLETESYKCLLDVGASDLFARNAKLMNIDISDVDYLFISHGHADHIGGLPAFLEINQKAIIVLSSQIFNREFYSSRKSLRKISFDFEFNTIKERLIAVDEKALFEEEIVVLKSEIREHPLPKANKTLFKSQEMGLINDDFDHELIITVGKDNRFVFTGCGHSGLLNIMDSVTAEEGGQIACVMGGFHLLDSQNNMEFETEEEVIKLGQKLKSRFPTTRFITGHCTGDHAFSHLKSILVDQLAQFYAGYELEV